MKFLNNHETTCVDPWKDSSIDHLSLFVFVLRCEENACIETGAMLPCNAGHQEAPWIDQSGDRPQSEILLAYKVWVETVGGVGRVGG